VLAGLNAQADIVEHGLLAAHYRDVLEVEERWGFVGA
jgi:hypothetical protein